MMSKITKFFAIWILIFALPMQGLAAVTMMNCEKSHSHEATILIDSHDHSLQSAHEEAATHQHGLDATDNHQTHHSSTSKHTCSHCCTCAVCCAGSAIIANSLNVPAHFEQKKANLTYTVAQFTSFISAGIERPPRFILV